jgi:hypothetical protein
MSATTHRHCRKQHSLLVWNIPADTCPRYEVVNMRNSAVQHPHVCDERKCLNVQSYRYYTHCLATVSNNEANIATERGGIKCRFTTLEGHVLKASDILAFLLNV